MNKKVLLSCLIFLSQTDIVRAEFSFKRVSSWVFRHKEEPFYKQYPFDSAGTIEIENSFGAIAVKTWDLPQIAVEAHKTANEQDLKQLNLAVDMTDTKACIKAKADNESNKGSLEISVIVPRKTNVKITTNNYPIQAKNIEGSLVAKTTSGNIELKNCSHNVKAETINGKIALSCTEITEHTQLSLESIKNNITLTLPKQVNAEVMAKTNSGTITSDHAICLKSKTCKLNQNVWQQIQRNIEGTIGTGGAQIALNSSKGNIKIIR